MKKKAKDTVISPRDRVVRQLMLGVLGFETTETRKSDSLDFKDCSVWGVKEALEKAYEEGQGNTEGSFVVSREKLCTGCDLYSICIGRQAVEKFQQAIVPLLEIDSENNEHPLDVHALVASRCKKFTPCEE